MPNNGAYPNRTVWSWATKHRFCRTWSEGHWSLSIDLFSINCFQSREPLFDHYQSNAHLRIEHKLRKPVSNIHKWNERKGKQTYSEITKKHRNEVHYNFQGKIKHVSTPLLIGSLVYEVISNVHHSLSLHFYNHPSNSILTIEADDRNLRNDDTFHLKGAFGLVCYIKDVGQKTPDEKHCAPDREEEEMIGGRIHPQGGTEPIKLTRNVLCAPSLPEMPFISNRADTFSPTHCLNPWKFLKILVK